MKKPVKKIVAIGGGDFWRDDKNGKRYTKETIKIDKEIIALTGKKKPNFLFIPTASSDSVSYSEKIEKYYKKLGCGVDTLFLLRADMSHAEISKKILSADIVYVGGGNTLKMMTLWRKLGVDNIFKKAHDQGIVLSGVSAGAICWFNYGNSDSRKFTSNSSQLIKVRGLGLVDALLCPHFNTEKHRSKELKRMMKSLRSMVSIALDDSCAMEIIDDKYKIITSEKSAKAYVSYWEKGSYIQNEIPQNSGLTPLNFLLSLRN